MPAWETPHPVEHAVYLIGARGTRQPTGIPENPILVSSFHEPSLGRLRAQILS